MDNSLQGMFNQLDEIKDALGNTKLSGNCQFCKKPIYLREGLCMWNNYPAHVNCLVKHTIKLTHTKCRDFLEEFKEHHTLARSVVSDFEQWVKVREDKIDGM